MISQLTDACRSACTSWWTAASLAATGTATYYFSKKTEDDDQEISTLFNTTLAAGVQLMAAFVITGYRLYKSQPPKLGPPPGLPFITQEERLFNMQITHADLLVGCREKGAIDEAVNTFDRMASLNIPRNVYHYTIMIDLFARANQPERSYACYQEMLHNGIKPNHPCYGALLKAYILQKNERMVQMILADMTASGLQPNRINCQQLCQWYGSQGDQSKSAHYFALSNDRCVKNEFCEINCHAMTSEGAFFACQPHLEALKEGEFLYIITGRGRHSKHDRGFFDLRDNLMKKIEENFPNLYVRVNGADMGQLEVDVKRTSFRPCLGPSA